MISIKDAEEILKHEYHLDNFTYLVKDILLPDFTNSKHDVNYNNEIFQSVKQIGDSSACNLSVFEVYLTEDSKNRRVAITQEMFKILRSFRIDNALVAFVNPDERNYRISLLTSKYEYDGDKIARVLSNPRRFSYSLGFGTKTKTAYKFLIEKGTVNTLDELVERFSVEVVNKQFYNEIALCYSKLVGGERDGKKFERLLGLYSVVDQKKYAEFAVRLIGRITFCWFLKEKKSENGIPLIPDKYLTIDEINHQDNYYHKVLEPLFFELLNTNQKKRKDKYTSDEFKQIPYLNGGLFSPHADDLYKYDNFTQYGKYGLVNIPNGWFVDFYNILSQYNFTVDENTSYDIELSIDPEMLGRIFENLLAEINPETGENAKKSTGSFYTPRDIVDYMVDSSLCEYLKTKTGLDETRLKALISYGKEDDSIATFDIAEKKKIINALYSITVLDPACGSGAFPIGMLQKIVYILQEIDPSADLWFDKATENFNDVFLKKEFEKKFKAGDLNYIRKLKVIQNSIFGIDIQPIAVEISRLRCFLSLVIEETVNDEEENRGINPLPNLDFKFIIANSLIGLEQTFQMSLFENQDHINRLKDIRDEYFNADNERRKELKLEFKDVQQDMLLNTIANYQKQASARYQQLSAWKPFENEATNWFDADWMFGIKDGFDIVIGNPPYIQLQKMHEEADKIAKQNYKTFTRTGDLYCIFYEFGYNVLKENGILTYITSNKWMRAAYGESLRKFFTTKMNPVLLIDFFGQKVFETATVDVNILLLKKQKNEEHTFACQIKSMCRGNLSNYIEQNKVMTIFSQNNEAWTILNPIEKLIKEKIELVGTPLKDWKVSINYGIKTGLNEAFIIDEDTKNKLVEEDPKSAEIIRPILRGRDIEKYSYRFANLYLIATFPSRKIDIENYPAVKKYLLGFGRERLEQTGKEYIINGTKIKSRKKTNNKWFETQDSISYWEDFFEQKIIYPETTQNANFYLDSKGFFADKTCFIMKTDKAKYLLATLSSSLFEYAYKKIFSSIELGISGYQYNKHALVNLPILLPNKEQETIINNLVDKILSCNINDRSNIQNEININIAKLYGIDEKTLKKIRD